MGKSVFYFLIYLLPLNLFSQNIAWHNPGKQKVIEDIIADQLKNDSQSNELRTNILIDFHTNYLGHHAGIAGWDFFAINGVFIDTELYFELTANYAKTKIEISDTDAFPQLQNIDALLDLDGHYDSLYILPGMLESQSIIIGLPLISGWAAFDILDFISKGSDSEFKPNYLFYNKMYNNTHLYIPVYLAKKYHDANTGANINWLYIYDFRVFWDDKFMNANYHMESVTKVK